MEAPLCKLCGERHYGMCDYPVKDLKAGDKIEVVVVGEAIKPDLKAGYNAYMREYMRKKRAKDKAK